MNVVKAKVPQVNLLPDVKINLLKARLRRNVMMAVCVGILVACGVVMVLLVTSLTAVVFIKSGIDSNVHAYKAKIEHEQRNGDLNEYMTIQNQLKQISALKQKQERFSLIFDYLARLNPTGRNSIKINTLSIRGLNKDASSDNTGIIDITGTTADYASLYVLKLTLEKAKLHYHLANPDGSVTDQEKTVMLFPKVTVTGGAQSSSMSFSATLKYNHVMFAYNITDTNIEVPTETISDSRSNVPKSGRKLFDIKPEDKKKPKGKLQKTADTVSNTSSTAESTTINKSTDTKISTGGKE